MNSDFTTKEIIKDDEIDLLSLFGIIWKRKVLIIVLTAASAAIAVGFSIMTLFLPPEKNPLPNVYKPHALILVNNPNSGGSLSSMLSASGLGGLAGFAGISTGGGYGELAVKLAKGKTILDIISEEFKISERYQIKESVASNARKILYGNFLIVYEKGTNTINITYEDYDPVFARDIVNRMVELLDHRFATIGGNKSRSQMVLLENKLSDVKSEISRIENEIKAFQTKYGILDVESIATEQVAVLAQLRSQLIMKDMEIKTYSEFATIEDPVLRRLRTERDNIAKMIGEMESGYSQYKGTAMPVQKDIPDLVLQFEHLKQDLLVQVKIYELLTQQYEMTKLNAEGDGPIFQVLELAEAPDMKSGPSRGMICIVVTFSAFFFSIILAFALNAIESIRKDPERMRKLKGGF